MDSKLMITVSDALFLRSEAKGDEIVAGYRNGKNAASLAVSSHGAERNPTLQTRARVAECAFCLWANLDPLTALNWSEKCDPGYDVVLHGYRFDVKASGPNGRFLIWPIRKNRILASKRFDMLAFVRVDGRVCELVGWIPKFVFEAEHEIADDDHKLDAGTWFVDERKLYRFSTPDWWGVPF